MDDEDPFAVVAPSEKKMSSYLKKSKDVHATRCPETSSQGTNSTRSTTASTLSKEDLFSHKSSKSHSMKKRSSGTLHHSSSSGGSANFDFGNGLEFGQGFSNATFGDDGFGGSSQPSKADRKPQSARSIPKEPDPFVDAAPKSMRNFSSNKSDGFDAFGSGDAFGSDPFASSSDPFQPTSDGFPEPFDSVEAINFGDDGFGGDAFGGSAFGSDGFGDDGFPSKSNHDREKDEFKKPSRSRSGDVPSRQRRAPRRHRSSDDVKDFFPEEDFSSPSKPSSERKKPTSSRSFRESRHNDEEPSRPASFRRPPGDSEGPRGGHRNRRGSVDTSNHSQERNARRPPRRASVTTTSSEGSHELGVRAPPAARDKASAGPAHRPGAGRRQKRTTLSSTHSGNLELMQMSFASAQMANDKDGDEDDKEEKDPEWEKERMENQQKIMDMYRDGSSGGKGGSSSSMNLDLHIDKLGLSDGKLDASASMDESRSRSRRERKAKETKETSSSVDGRDRNDRQKGSLLDRVGSSH